MKWYYLLRGSMVVTKKKETITFDEILKIGYGKDFENQEEFEKFDNFYAQYKAENKLKNQRKDVWSTLTRLRNMLFMIWLGIIIGVVFERTFNKPECLQYSFKENVFQKFGKDAGPPILYLHNHLTDDTPNAPAKIFVVTENFNDILHFNGQVSEVFKPLNVTPLIIDVTPEMSSTNLFHEFTHLITENEKPLIIINNVNKLKGVSPLMIQRIVDPDTAPSKNATIILTASGMTFPETITSKKQCEIFVRKYLLDTWSSHELSEEQTEPIISRCTGVVICLPSKRWGEL